MQPQCHKEQLGFDTLDGLSLAELIELKGLVDHLIKKKHPTVAKCLNCGEEFAIKRPWQKYCSVKCRNEKFWRDHEVVDLREVNIQVKFKEPATPVVEQTFE